MDELAELLRPSWGAEKWILEGWNQITADEKTLITRRMDDLFKEGLPFELKHDKSLYLYTFSFLAQLEVLAIQVPLKFEAKMSTSQFKQRMHTQLLDEIFHGMVFTKIVYLLCAPYALPPAYSENIETLCNFIREEDCPKVAIMLLNLIGEGWIEEIFKSLKQQNIAPNVFETILNDEHRHVCEADLYSDMGMPDMAVVRKKLAYLEEQLLTNIFLQYKYMVSVCTLLGTQGMVNFMRSLNEKHTTQLQKINMVPSEKWQDFMQMGQGILPKFHNYSQSNRELAMTPLRQVFMTQWDNPSDPTMVGQFNLNVSCLDFFGKKYPPETLTTLMLQAISKALSQFDTFRAYLSHKKLYQSEEAYVGIVVKLPACGDHIGTIVFKNCHEIPTQALSVRIRQVLEMMVYCFKRREQLEKKHPHLQTIFDGMLYDFSNNPYPYPIPGNPVVALSNIGSCGYSQTKSPLRSNEAMKVTLLEVERRQVWNKKTNEFEVQDILPVSLSADHRVVDGNLPVPKLLASLFNELFQEMEKNNHVMASTPNNKKQDAYFIKILDYFLTHHLELGYRILNMLQTVWPDFMEIEDLFKHFQGEEINEVELHC